MGMADIILKDTKIIEFDIDKIVDAVLAAMPESDFELSKEERKNYNRFIRIMSEIEWPAYMDGDIDFHETIINLYENGTIEDVIVAVHEHYNSDYIDDLHKRLEESDVISKNRVPIIKEALELYKLGIVEFIERLAFFRFNTFLNAAGFNRFEFNIVFCHERFKQCCLFFCTEHSEIINDFFNILILFID